MGLGLKLYFIGTSAPQLDRVEFSHPFNKTKYLSVRGKTSGGHTQTNRTFQWTSAVQGLSLLFVKGALFSHKECASRLSNLNPSLEGEKGSIVASIDYALDKQPLWLLDMFGATGDNRSYLKSLLKRSNPGLKREGPTLISLNNDLLVAGIIQVMLNNSNLEKFEQLLELYRALEKSCGALNLNEVIRDAPSEAVSSVPRVSQGASRFKTPFVRQGTPEGDVFCRVYERNGNLALVSIFEPLETLDIHRAVPVRIHSSCVPSDILGSVDCDCHSQLVRSRAVLRQNSGILIHLFQEGRGAGLFSKYLGMSLSAQYGVDSYEAYKRLSLAADSRSYELAAMVLEDLGIKNVILLSNNPTKIEELSKFGFLVKQQECYGTMTPQNISYLYDKMTKRHHTLNNLFNSSATEFFFCKSMSHERTFPRVWIFGGDDTLWEDNIVYEDIIRQFTDYICQWIPTLQRHLVRETLDLVETELIPHYGFGAPGFLESLKESFRRLVEEKGLNLEEPRDLFDSVLSRLSSIGAAIPYRTIEVLQRLRDMNHGLVLFTQGPLEIQLGKIAQSRLGEYFHGICIVPRKSPETLRKLCDNLPFSTSDFVVVGSSMTSDILPARDIGINALHYRNPNSWHLINNISAPIPEVPEITSLTELLTHAETELSAVGWN